MHTHASFRTSLVASLLALTLSSPVWSWEGRKQHDDTEVEIHRGELVQTGEDIEIYDVEEDEYQGYTVDGIERDGDVVYLYVEDDETGESEVIEMYDEDYEIEED